MRKFLFCILSLPCFVCFSHAQAEPSAQTSASDTGIEQLLEGEAPLDIAFSRATAGNYPDADSVIVADATFSRYNPDGTGESVNEWYERILTEKGRRESSTMSVWFNPVYGSAVIEFARVIKPDRTVRDIDINENSRVMIDPSQMASNIYDPNSKILTLSLPGIEVGDVLHVKIRRVSHKARMPGFFGDYFVTEYTSPVIGMRYEILAPAQKPLKSIVRRDPSPGVFLYGTERRPDGSVSHVWTARDVPQAFPEPGMPAVHTCLSRVMVSTADDWREISRWYWKLCEPHLAASPEMERKVEELIGNAAGDGEKIRSIFKFVSQQIRYMGVTPEEVAPGYEPHDAAMTFKNRYGVCRDKAALLAAMLRIAGLEAYPVLIHAGERRDPDVPLPYFNHAVTAVKMPDGTFLLMDSTNESSAVLLPEYLCEKSYLTATPAGEPLRVSPPLDPASNMVEIVTSGTVCKADGGGLSATGCVTRISFSGINDTVYRNAFSTMDAQSRIRFARSILARAAPNAVLSGIELSPEDMQDTSSPLSMELRYELENAVSPGKACVLSEPSFHRVLGVANLIFPDTHLIRRKYPLEIEMPCGVNEKVSMTLPEELRADRFVRNGDTRHEGGGAYFSRETDCVSSGEGNVYSSSTSLIFAKSLFPTNDYAPLRSAAEARSRAFSIPAVWDMRESGASIAASGADVMFRAVSGKSLPDDLSDSVFLRSAKTVVQRSETGGWTVSDSFDKFIATYDGKNSDSDVSVDFFPDYAEADITNAVSIAGNGSVHAVSPLERNLMDQPWVSSAPRYSPGRRLVVSFPGAETGGTLKYTSVIRYLPGRNDSFSVRIPISVFGGYAERVIEIPAGTDEFVSRIVAPPQKMSRTASADSIVLSLEGPGMNNGLPAEPSMPPAASFMGAVEISTETSEQYVRRLEDAVRKASSSPSPLSESAIREAARELGPNPSVESIVRLVRDFVETSVRTVNVGFWNFPLSEISLPDETLKSGYGHSLDKLVLAKAMLRILGVESSDMFFNSSWQGLDPATAGYPSAPAIHSDFRDAALRIDDGKSVFFIDGSSQYADVGACAYEGRIYAGGSDLSLHIVKPSSPDFAASDVVKVDAEVFQDGSAELSVSVRKTGFYAEKDKRKWSELLPEERSREILSEAASWAESAELKGAFETDVGGIGFSGKFSLRIPDFASVSADGRFMSFKLPHAGVASAPGALSKRLTPYLSSFSGEKRCIWNIRLPDSSDAVLFSPSDFDYVPAEGSVSYSRRTAAPHPGVITVSSSISCRSMRLSPEQYLEMCVNLYSSGTAESDTIVIHGGFQVPKSGGG